MAAHMKRERLAQILGGLAVILGSILGSMWLRMNA